MDTPDRDSASKEARPVYGSGPRPTLQDSPQIRGMLSGGREVEVGVAYSLEDKLEVTALPFAPFASANAAARPHRAQEPRHAASTAVQEPASCNNQREPQ